jgi:hypothetical protein
MKITTLPGELCEGLFGQIILWVFEVLPYLHLNHIYPEWAIKSEIYGCTPHYTVLPGLLDLVYEPVVTEVVTLQALRKKHLHVLGGHWAGVSDLWHSYFAVPNRVLEAADSVALSTDTLGVHYRGNDKNAAPWDTNSVSHADFIKLVGDFISTHPAVNTLFVATDEHDIVGKLEAQLPRHLRLISLPKIAFHKDATASTISADRALLDCVLLARCRYVVKCSSALSAFAKILNPGLEIYRLSASKMFSDVPYFPDAYIPRLRSSDPECSAILRRLFADDWLDNAAAKRKFGKPFTSRPRISRGDLIKRRFKGLAKRALNLQ